MRPSTNVDGDLARRASELAPARSASMRPSTNVDGDPGAHVRQDHRDEASMRPSTNVDGDDRDCTGGNAALPASMRPSTNVDGDFPDVELTRVKAYGFNEAVDERRR